MSKPQTTFADEQRMAIDLGFNPNRPSSWPYPELLQALARFERNESREDFKIMLIWLMRLFNA